MEGPSINCPGFELARPDYGCHFHFLVSDFCLPLSQLLIIFLTGGGKQSVIASMLSCDVLGHCLEGPKHYAVGRPDLQLCINLARLYSR